MDSVHCTVCIWRVHYEVFSVKNSIYSLTYRVSYVICEAKSLQNAVCSVEFVRCLFLKCEVFNVKCMVALFSLYCVVFNINCTVKHML